VTGFFLQGLSPQQLKGAYLKINGFRFDVQNGKITYKTAYKNNTKTTLAVWFSDINSKFF
jgi:hypothetical protein